MKHKLGRTSIFILFIGLFGIWTTAVGAPGDLDTTFSQDGKLVEIVGSGINTKDYLRRTAIQADGKIVAVGYDSQLKIGCEVVRYNTDGSLDTSFDGDGKTTVATGLTSGCFGVAIQADGKIVGVGGSGSGVATGSTDIFVIRLNPDGTLDNSFDGDGKLTTDVLGAGNFALAVAIQADGKIVAAGEARNSANTDFAVVRYNTDGSLDTTFDGDGKATTDVVPGFFDSAGDVVIQADGKILAVGASRQTFQDFAVVRYNTDGSLDTTFDGDGKLTTDFFGSSDSANSVALQNDGKIVVAGSAFLSGSPTTDAATARYNSDGSLDTSFDVDGKLTTDFSNGVDKFSGISIQTDGRIVATGSTSISGTNNDRKLMIARYNPNGSLDNSFDGDGKVTTDFPNNREEGGNVSLQTDGKIVVAGYSETPTFSDADFALARYNPNGSPDTTFDADGKVTTNITATGQASSAQAVAVQADGKIVAAGYGKNSLANDDFIVVRYNQNGSLDTSFDADGQVQTDFLGNRDQIFAVAVQPDGKIVAAGYAGNGMNEFVALARYNTDGSLDTTFDGDGKLTTNVLGSFSYAYGVAVQADGKIVAAGYAYNGANSDVAIVRYNPNGSLDTSFNGSGQLTSPILGAEDELYAVAIQPDGKIVATGSAYNGGSWIPAVVRCNPNGSFDASFDGDGILTTTLAVTRQGANGVALQNDGKIVVVFNDGNFTSTMALARYNSNGSPDTSFDGDGIVITSGVIADAIAIQTDGKIVVGGTTNDFAVLRYNTDGSLDSSFGAGGKSIFDITNGLSDRIYGLTIDSSKRIIAVGDSGGFFAAARVLGDSGSSRTKFDFDGDGKADVSVFRPSNGVWYLQQSTAGFNGFAFGQAGDKLAPADYDGDGKTDIAVVRNGTWYLQRSQLGFTGIQFGDGNDVPVPADYDGDGKADLAVFRPSNGVWYLQQSTAGFTGFAFGANGDKPVPADYDGDGKSDVAVNRAGTWYVQRTQLGFTGITFGDTNDKLVPADYDGDGKADIAVFRPSNGVWYLQQSTAGFAGIAFGTGMDVPAAADYDGDGKADIAVFRPSNGVWYLNRSTQGFTGIAFGDGNDKPVPSAFVP